MKKILIFSLAYYPHVGGAEIAIKEITDRIHDNEFHLLTLRFNNEARTERIGNVQVHRIGNGGSYVEKILFLPRAALMARRLHRELMFDGLWAMMSYMLFPIVLLRFLGVKIPYALTLQEGDPWSHMFGRWYILPFRPFLSFGFRHATRITAISTYLARWAEHMGFRKEVDLVPNGVDLTTFWATTLRDVPSSAPVLITTSRLVHKNAVDTVIRALPFIEGAKFIIYGTGTEEQKLKDLSRTLGVESRVEFRGHVDHAHLPQALKEGDIFIRPSRSEGMGNSFIEAMAAGLPVIGTSVGGISDFLYDGRGNPDEPDTGWVVDVDAPEQIAKVVRYITAHPAEVRAVRENAQKLVRERYGWIGVANDMRDVLSAL